MLSVPVVVLGATGLVEVVDETEELFLGVDVLPLNWVLAGLNRSSLGRSPYWKDYFWSRLTMVVLCLPQE